MKTAQGGTELQCGKVRGRHE